ncbi:hypothetical protein [Schlesneria paludicola]|uniref:hypothetical protein n=1 Tax=Schlesneria paludicola TaxID=360056 RepID=UPI00029A5ED6|nr:hypothetical protein [Schlesneria paludicola]
MSTREFSRLRNAGSVVGLWVVSAVVGCGGAANEIKVAPVKGKVTVKGSDPFEKGLVVFAPKTAGKNLGGSATTDDQGNFVLRHATGKPGIEPGEYHVFFSQFRMPDGAPLPDQAGEREPKTPQELGGVQWVPLEYSTMKSTKNPVTVEAKGGSFDFDLPELKAQKVTAARRK